MTTIPLDEEVLRLRILRRELKRLEHEGGLSDYDRRQLANIDCEIDSAERLEASMRDRYTVASDEPWFP